MTVQTASWIGMELSDGRYRVVEQLGEGGMGVVYRAHDSRLRTDVVIKAPLRKFIHNEDIVRRFQREVHSLVQLSHPHIVKIIDVGNHDGLPFAVLHYLSGGSLKDRQRRGADGQPQPLPITTLADWLLPVAQALDFIHQQNFIHRDVKPPNILFDAHGNVYLSDFGIAKAMASVVQPTTGQTQHGQMFGTPGYMAPELIEGLPCDGRSDQYALALTAYEMLAGRGPFHGVPLGAVMLQQRQHQFPMLHHARPDAPVWLSEAIHRSLSYDPSDRHATCAAMAQALLQPPAKATGGVGQGVRLPCPTCKKSLKVPGDARGRRVTCPYCRTSSVVAQDMASLSAVPAAAPAQASGTMVFACPRCRQHLQAATQLAGTHVTCVHCRNVVPVPGAPAAAPPAMPPAPQSLPFLPIASPAQETDYPPPNSRTVPGGLPVASLAPPNGKSRTFALILGLLLLAGAAVGILALTGAFSKTPSVSIDDDGLVTADDVISGTLTIDFDARKDNAPDGAQDIYNVDLHVRTSPRQEVIYTGKITRQQDARRKIVGGKKEPIKPDRLDMELLVRTQQLDDDGKPVPGKVEAVATFTGRVKIDSRGRYHFDKVEWDSGEKHETCKGLVQGRPPDKVDRQPRTLTFDAGNETLEIKLVDRFDPMGFQNLHIPGDPRLGLLPVQISGEFNFNYRKVSFLTDNLVFDYGDTRDRVQGKVLWVREPAAYLNGKKENEKVENGVSQYVFDLAFNPRKADGGPARTVDDEKDLVVGKDQARLYGEIVFHDSGTVKLDEDYQRLYIDPLHSRIDFHLHARRLTPTQIHNFLKMWLLMSGPVNDE